MILNLSKLKSNITLRLTNKNLTIIVCEIIFFIYIFIEENLWNIMEYYYSIISIKIECRNLSESFKNKFVKKCLQLCKYVVS